MPGAARRWRDPVRQRVPLAPSVADGGGGRRWASCAARSGAARCAGTRHRGALSASISAERERTRGSSAVVAGLGRW